MQTQEVSIKPNLKVILKNNAELLDEVIVTAYGTAKKSAFTGSASVVSSEDIGKIQSSNVANALSEKCLVFNSTTTLVNLVPQSRLSVSEVSVLSMQGMTHLLFLMVFLTMVT